MYNVYLIDKKNEQQKRAKKIQDIGKNIEQDREILINRYKERINSNLIILNRDAEKIPRLIRDNVSMKSERTWLKTSGFSSEKQRIQEACEKNHWLDTTPSEKIGLKLRPREKSKEIQPQFRLKCKTELERLEENILSQKQCFDTSESPASCRKSGYKNYFGMEKYKFSGGRDFLDYYHYKTHFKTIESLALDLHSSIRNLSKAQLEKKRNDEKLGMNERNLLRNKTPDSKSKDLEKASNRRTPDDVLCQEDVMPISSEIMTKYGLWHIKQPINLVKSRNCTPKW